MSKLRPPRRVSAAGLEAAALFYLERFASSAENLRRVLMRRVERAARHWGDDPAEGAALVDRLVARYQASGLLDDRIYAEARSRSLFRRGSSARVIRQHLSARGVATEVVEAAVAGLRAESDGDEDPDLAAAHAYARRRRLGPYRPPEMRADQRSRDIACLGRAGFSFDVARAVVDGEGR